LASTFLDYLIPTTAEIPDVECHHIETAASTPGGFKGVGEGGAIGAPPAVFNAVADALAQVGATVTDQPLDPTRVLTALRAARN
jgi:carbon-monoxide dehydrogenase large subunit